jgi:hypothetical protein
MDSSGMMKNGGADDIEIASRSDLDNGMASIARAHRMVFFAGLPGVGKSLLIRELARIAHETGRDVSILQWDTARPSSASHPLLARYPERDGITHPVVRAVIGQWARGAVLRWDRNHTTSTALLIGEVPLIGNRLLELVQVQADAAEPLLAGPEALFVTPVPSSPVRVAIENARRRTFANPNHPREQGDAPPDAVRGLWLETHALAVELGAVPPVANAPAPFDPRAYAAVYRHLLRHRHAVTVRMNVELGESASVYDLGVSATDLVPSEDEMADVLARLERRHTTAEIEDRVIHWFHSV